MTTKSLGNGYVVKDGKLVKVHRYSDASARIRARKSKKVRVGKGLNNGKSRTDS